MKKRVVQLTFVSILLAGLFALGQIAQAQNPTPAALGRPDYNYSEANGCTSCHFIRGALGDHMLEAVGVSYSDTTKTFSFTGNGWYAAKHSQTNYGSTQNTYCARCHSPLQASAEAQFKPGMAQPIPNGKVEGVTCATCHPSHNSAVVLGRRLGIYKFGMDKNTPEAYDVVHEGNEDLLCTNCHTRHNEGNPAFDLMYVAGVRCIDCHMAVYGKVPGTEVDKRFHDFKVGKNLPYSCGVEGSVIGCHPGFSVQSTAAFIPYLKDQHRWMWDENKQSRKLKTGAAAYLKLWKDLEAGVQK